MGVGRSHGDTIWSWRRLVTDSIIPGSGYVGGHCWELRPFSQEQCQGSQREQCPAGTCCTPNGALKVQRWTGVGEGMNPGPLTGLIPLSSFPNLVTATTTCCYTKKIAQLCLVVVWGIKPGTFEPQA